MADEIPSIINHVSLGTNDFETSTTFYDAVLKTIGATRIIDIPHAVAYGKQFPEFWVQKPINGETAEAGNGTHICFMTTGIEQVKAFYDAALTAGATSARTTPSVPILWFFESIIIPLWSREFHHKTNETGFERATLNSWLFP